MKSGVNMRWTDLRVIALLIIALVIVAGSVIFICNTEQLNLPILLKSGSSEQSGIMIQKLDKESSDELADSLKKVLPIHTK